jgi:uncharacterized membrane protein YkvA (DUF1232 family)
MTDNNDNMKSSLSECKDHGCYYSEEALSEKLLILPKNAVGQVLEKALLLRELLFDSNTPIWIKGSIIGCLSYFILPIDMIPDVIPGAGYVDDLAAMTILLSTLSSYVSPEIRRRANRRMPGNLRPSMPEAQTEQPV